MNPQHQEEKSVGRILKEARTVKNISLETASKGTRIHVNILKAMESDATKSLGPVYTKGFLKLYAEYLDLNKEEILKRYQAALDSGELSRARRIRFPGEQPLIKTFAFGAVLAKALRKIFRKNNYKILAGLLVFLVVIGLLQLGRHHRKTVSRRAGATTAKTAQTAKTSKEDRLKPTPSPVVKKEAAPTVSASAAPAQKSQEKINLVLRAKEKTWLQVKVDGKVVFQGILARGATESWQASDKIGLWLGNAGAVELELNGKLLKKIGRPGKPLKNVLITRSGLSING
ncbi:MAG: RodZ domain-containing protein [Candidatus Omnitrophota bacterium]